MNVTKALKIRPNKTGKRTKDRKPEIESSLQPLGTLKNGRGRLEGVGFGFGGYWSAMGYPGTVSQPI